MKFDSNLAWKDAAASVSANREVLLALAGVFFLLPSLAFALLVPGAENQLAARTGGAQSLPQIMAQLRGFYSDILPWIIIMGVVQAVGTLSLLTLFTDKSRPTVGDAIKQGAMGLLPYFAAQMLIGFGIALAAVTLVGIASATGVKALAVIIAIAALVGAIYIGIKTSLAAAIIMVEGQRNPIAAIKRSWDLTKGNSVRIAVFYLLLAVVFVIVMSVIGALIGILAALIMGPEAVKIISAVISSTMGAVVTLYFTAVLAAIHRQLAGPSSDVVAAAFE